MPMATTTHRDASSTNPASPSPAAARSASAERAPSGRDLTARLWSEDLPREHAFEPLEIEGRLPAELAGTLFRNGPGQFGMFGKRYGHPFEGDGAVTAVRFGGGKVLGASRITQSRGLVEERAAGKALYGFSVPWLRRMRNMLGGRDKNTANTSVMVWQDRLFAMVESSKPTEIAPSDLATIGETDLGGVVRGAFSAHPHRVAARRATYNFGVIQGRRPELVVYELPDAGAARELVSVPLAAPTMLHDFIATEHHLVFFVSPVRVDVAKMLAGFSDFSQLFRWKPELGTEVIIVNIDRPSDVVRFTTDAFYQWHFANAFERGERGQGELVVDYVRYPTFESFGAIGRTLNGGNGDVLKSGRYHRATIDLAARTLRSEQLLDRACEFTTIEPGAEGREHAHAYMVLDDLGGIGRLDLRTGELVAHELPRTQRTTEPLFVPRADGGGGGGGYIVALQHDGPTNRAFAAVYDAARLPDGPIARAWFDHQIPITFHGTFASRL
ncbi:MAG TPA: carotenoid oxygenase family protein [Kofleriaceae bacterium]